jgi:hypothetical protein
MKARLFLATLTLALVGWATPPTAQSDGYGDYEVKAAFLFNFAKFVEWPADAFERTDTPIVIGVVGDSPMGAALERTVEGKQVNGRSLVVRRLRWDDDTKNRQILFVSAADETHVHRFLDRLKGQSVLTVGDMPGLARRGVVINFVLEQNRVRFEINVEAARRARLALSSKLLSLARIVGGE